MVSVGVGMGNYNDALLERLADQGDGFYVYVDSQQEAERVFVDRLASTIESVALDAKAQVDFDPDVVAAYRLIGYENRDVPDEQFRNPTVPAGAIGADHSVTALYAIRLREGHERAESNRRLATVLLRWSDPQTKRTSEMSVDVNGSAICRGYFDTDTHFKLDSLVAAAAEVLRGSPWVEGYRLADIRNVASEIRGSLPQTAETADFLRMLDEAAGLYD